MTIPAGIGGPQAGPAGHIQAGANPGVSLYVQVGDLRTTIDQWTTGRAQSDVITPR
jgi:hypothetical protein